MTAVEQAWHAGDSPQEAGCAALFLILRNTRLFAPVLAVVSKSLMGSATIGYCLVSEAGYLIPAWLVIHTR